MNSTFNWSGWPSGLRRCVQVAVGSNPSSDTIKPISLQHYDKLMNPEDNIGRIHGTYITYFYSRCGRVVKATD